MLHPKQPMSDVCNLFYNWIWKDYFQADWIHFPLKSTNFVAIVYLHPLNCTPKFSPFFLHPLWLPFPFCQCSMCELGDIKRFYGATVTHIHCSFVACQLFSSQNCPPKVTRFEIIENLSTGTYVHKISISKQRFIISILG